VPLPVNIIICYAELCFKSMKTKILTSMILRVALWGCNLVTTEQRNAGDVREESSVLQKTCWFKRGEVTEGGRKLHIGELTIGTHYRRPGGGGGHATHMK
jgi:hypothetical protein